MPAGDDPGDCPGADNGVHGKTTAGEKIRPLIRNSDSDAKKAALRRRLDRSPPPALEQTVEPCRPLFNLEMRESTGPLQV